MQKIKQFFKALSDWLFVGPRLPLIIAAFVVIACVVTAVAVSNANKPKDDIVTAYVTVSGLGEKDFSNRQIKIVDGDSIKQIFSLEYESIYNDFGKPLVQYNEFYSFLGVKKTLEKSFHVKVDDLHENNLDQAYVYGGQTITITYE